MPAGRRLLPCPPYDVHARRRQKYQPILYLITNRREKHETEDTIETDE